MMNQESKETFLEYVSIESDILFLIQDHFRENLNRSSPAGKIELKCCEEITTLLSAAVVIREHKNLFQSNTVDFLVHKHNKMSLVNDILSLCS